MGKVRLFFKKSSFWIFANFGNFGGNFKELVRYGGKRGLTENFQYYIITLGNIQQCTYFPKDRSIALVIHKYLAYYSSWCRVFLNVNFIGVYKF